MDSVKYDNHQRNTHNNTLNQVCGGYGHKTAHDGVTYDYYRSDNHRHMILDSEETGEQCSDRLKARRRIRNKENQNYNRRDTHQNVFLVPETSGKEIRNGNRVAFYRIAAQTLRHNQPVQIGSQTQADSGPTSVRDAGQISDARQSHQEPAAHIGSLRAHRRYQRS